MEPWREELYHHGINGQKWGVRNGPPYPLTLSAHSSKERRNNPKSTLSKYDSEARKEKRRVKGLYDKAKYAGSVSDFTVLDHLYYQKRIKKLKAKGYNESDRKLRKAVLKEKEATELHNKARKAYQKDLEKAFDAATKFANKYGNDKAKYFKFSEDSNGKIDIYYKHDSDRYDLAIFGKAGPMSTFYLGPIISSAVGNAEFNRYIKNLG